MLWCRPVGCAQNETYSEFWGFASGTASSSTPFSFTGMSAIFTVTEAADVNSPQLLRLTTAANPTQFYFGSRVINGVTFGTIELVLPQTTTLGLPPGVGYYDVNVANGSTNLVYSYGAFTVQPTVSR